MALKNPILFVLVFIFVSINILDSITAHFILPGEANPLYLISGNIWFVHALKLVLICFVIYWYKQNLFESHFSYYMLIMILIMASLILMLGVASNMYGIINPAVLEESAGIPTGEKIRAYLKFVMIIYIIPNILALFGFKLFEWSGKYVRFGKKYYPNRKWWQI